MWDGRFPKIQGKSGQYITKISALTAHSTALDREEHINSSAFLDFFFFVSLKNPIRCSLSCAVHTGFLCITSDFQLVAEVSVETLFLV